MVACEKTIEQTPVADLLDQAVRDIAGRVAGLDLTRSDFVIKNSPEWNSFMIETTGDYKAAIVIGAEEPVFYEIARKMKRNPEVTEKDVIIYVTEFFNILCGFFLSRLNSMMGLKSRFRIPEFIKGQCIQSANMNQGAVRIRYECPYGRIQVHGAGLPIMM